MIAGGFGMTSVALYHITNLSLAIDFRTIMLWRMYQMSGLAFIFIPISILSYVGVPLDKNNQVSGISNFIRNLGGSVGISMLTTFLARQSQVHQTNLVAHATAANPQFNEYGAWNRRQYGQVRFRPGAGDATGLQPGHGIDSAAGRAALLRQCVLGGVGDRRLPGTASLPAEDGRGPAMPRDRRALNQLRALGAGTQVGRRSDPEVREIGQCFFSSPICASGANISVAAV